MNILQSASFAALLSITACNTGAATSGDADTDETDPHVETESAEATRDIAANALTDVSSPDAPPKLEQRLVLRPDPAYPTAPAPDAAAWQTAPTIETAHLPDECEARALGEFVRVSCVGTFMSYSESLAGDPKTVKYSHKDPKWSHDYSKQIRKDERAVVFPLAPGDRRVVQFADLSGGWRSPWTASTAAIVQAYWLEDEATPTITVN